MIERFVTLLFPPQCAHCSAAGSGLCSLCAPLHVEPLTRRLRSLDVSALGDYRGAFRRAVLVAKDGRRDAIAALGERLGALIPQGSILVPIPTTRARARVRGLDNVEAMARRAALRAGASVSVALAHAGSDAQRGRSRAGRLAAQGRFRCDPLLAHGRTVVLVDDVCTTGATLEDCAAVIRSAGGRVERAVVVALA